MSVSPKSQTCGCVIECEIVLIDHTFLNEQKLMKKFQCAKLQTRTLVPGFLSDGACMHLHDFLTNCNGFCCNAITIWMLLQLRFSGTSTSFFGMQLGISLGLNLHATSLLWMYVWRIAVGPFSPPCCVNVRLQ